MKKEDFSKLVDEIISEIQKEEDELDEITVTGNVDGYNTPNAFKKTDGTNPDDEPESDYVKRINTGTGYTKVNENSSWKRFLDPYTWFTSGETTFKYRYKKTHPAIVDRLIKITEKKGHEVERIGKNAWGITEDSAKNNQAVWQYLGGDLYYVNPQVKSIYDSIIPKLYNDFTNTVSDDVKKANLGDVVTFIDDNGNIVKGKVFNRPTADNKMHYGKLLHVAGKDRYTMQIISINGKPLSEGANRWHQLRKEDATPNRKIGVGIRNIRKQLSEIELFLNWYSKLKNENGLSKETYWKRTNRHLNAIRERLYNISQRISKL